MRLFTPICAVALTLLSVVSARSIAGNRVLVVLEENADKALYTQFWSDLESRQFNLDFQSPKSDSVKLFELGSLSYDHLILLPPKSKGYGPNLTPKHILDFTNAGGNVLLGLSSDQAIPSAISSLLLEFDITLPTERNARVIDHFNYDTATSTDEHSTLVLSRPGSLRSDTINFFSGAGSLAIPNAVPQTLGDSSLIAPILRAPATAYVHNPKSDEADADDLLATGSQLNLISAMQARNSARFTVLGSLEMLQDKWFDAETQTPVSKQRSRTVNKEFARQLTEWTFKEVGVLRVGKISHHQIMDKDKPISNTTQVGEVMPEIYRIKTDVSYTIDLSTWSRDHWEPFSVPSNDALQLEFTMLSPFHRLNLNPLSSTPSTMTYGTTFRTPDQHGVFAFKVNYKRPFLTYIEERNQITVRHFAHDEWPRSFVISAAWPWISALWVIIAGFLAFVVLWLYCEPPNHSALIGRVKEQEKKASS